MRSRLMLVTLVLAAAASAQPRDRLSEIREQQALLASELQSGVLKLGPRDVALVRKDQSLVNRLTEGRRLDDLSVQDRVDLDNALERINALVVATRAADESRDVCRYERKTGSRLPKLECISATDRRKHRDGARAYLEAPRICVPPGCGQ